MPKKKTDNRRELVARYVAQSVKAGYQVEHAGPDMVRVRLISPVTKGKDGKPRVLLSNARVDRHGDILRSSGAVLTDFRKNPVMLFGHRHDIPAVGKWVGITKDADGVWATPEFAPTPMGEQLSALYGGGFMNAWSVGFIPDKYEPIRDDSEDGDILGWDVKKWELLEASAVNVGANPDALGPKGMALSKAITTSTPEDVVEAMTSWYKAIIAGEEKAITEDQDVDDTPGTTLTDAFPEEAEADPVTDPAPEADPDKSDEGKGEPKDDGAAPETDTDIEVVSLSQETVDRMEAYADHAERAAEAMVRIAALKAGAGIEDLDLDAEDNGTPEEGSSQDKVSAEYITKALDSRDTRLTASLPKLIKIALDSEMGRVPG